MKLRSTQSTRTSRKQKTVYGAIGCCGCSATVVFLLFFLGLIGALITPAEITPEENNLTSSAPSPAPAETPAASPGSALAQLNELQVSPLGTLQGFDQEAFAWNSDTDHNGCTTQDDVLRRDLIDIQTREGTKGCAVSEGTLTSPYTGKSIKLSHGSDSVSIDHVVSLSNAWMSGASDWSSDQLSNFANDPINLLAVEKEIDEAKGDSDAVSWTPPSKKHQCPYVARQIAVKTKYSLSVSPQERDAIKNILQTCPNYSTFNQQTSWPKPIDNTPSTLVGKVPSNEAPKSAPNKVPNKKSAPLSEKPKEAPASKKSTLPAEIKKPSTKQEIPSQKTFVHPGAFCSGKGSSGISKKGKSMVCKPAKDGRLRWQQG